MALITAAVARWMTPFSGPIQRSCGSDTISCHVSPMLANSGSISRPSSSSSTTEAMAWQQISLPLPMVNVMPNPRSDESSLTGALIASLSRPRYDTISAESLGLVYRIR